MDIEIIAIGDEVLRGETGEDNATYLCRTLTAAGMEPVRITVLPDDRRVISEELAGAAARGRCVIATGGLGPTADDVTREAAIEALGGRSVLREDIVDSIRERFSSLGRKMPDGYRRLATIPEGAAVIPNSTGAANGLDIRKVTARIILLPGVPSEMRAMFESTVLPSLGGDAGRGRTVLRIFGMTETSAEDVIENVIGGEALEDVSIISGPGGVRVYLTPRRLPDGAEERLRKAFGSHLVAGSRYGMEGEVLELLRSKGKRLAVAESFTGGLLASLLVSVPGASDSFLEGFVTYSNEAKARTLGIDEGIIESHGAVSSEICSAMASGAVRMTGADFSLSTTGIAGPAGGTADKPVGLCYIGMAAPEGIYCREMQFPGDRETIRLRAAYIAIDMLRLRLRGAADRIDPFRL